MEVEIIGLPVDCCKEQTRVVDDNGDLDLSFIHCDDVYVRPLLFRKPEAHVGALGFRCCESLFFQSLLSNVLIQP